MKDKATVEVMRENREKKNRERCEKKYCEREL